MESDIEKEIGASSPKQKKPKTKKQTQSGAENSANSSTGSRATSADPLNKPEEYTTTPSNLLGSSKDGSPIQQQVDGETHEYRKTSLSVTKPNEEASQSSSASNSSSSTASDQ